MQERLPSPTQHASYQRHRRELWTRILLPMLLAIALIAVVAVLTGMAAFQPESEVGRWAAVSTMWVLLPLIGAGVLLLIVLIALIYGMARLLGVLPAYTLQAQDLFRRIQGIARQVADGAVKPILLIEGITATIKRLAGRK